MKSLNSYLCSSNLLNVRLFNTVFCFLLAIQISFSQCPEIISSSISPACPGGFCEFCQGQTITLKAQGGDLPNNGKIDYYISENPGFNPYNGEGTKIGSANITTNNPPCRVCPSLIGFMIDACGPEAANEFVVWHTGSGFNTSDVLVDFAPQNNGGGSDADIGSGCGVTGGPAGLIGGCSAISVGAGYNLPANSIFVLFTSSSASTVYDFSGVCSDVCNVYVAKSTCARTKGAFSNLDATGMRTQTFSITTCPCANVSVTYDTDDSSLSGDGDHWAGGIGNNGCASPSGGGGYSPATSIVSDFTYTIPSSWCGKTYELVGILNPKATSTCCMDQFTERFLISTKCPLAKATMLEVCEFNNGLGIFDLSEAESIILDGNTGVIEWYRDMAGTQKINSPFTSGNATVYARIVDGTCKSNIVAIQLKVNLRPIARNAFLEMCDEGGGFATFDLDKLIRAINGGNSALEVKFYEDFALSSEIASPYQSRNKLIFATTFDGKCESKPAEIRLIVLDRPEGFSITEKICDNGNGTATFDLNALLPKLTGGKTGLTVKFYKEEDLLTEIMSPYTTSSTTIYAQLFNGKCYSEPIEINLIISNLNAIPLAIDKICDDGNGQGEFDLVNIGTLLTNGDSSIIIKYFSDTVTMGPITLPLFVTGKDTIYAKLCKADCESSFITIILEAIKRPEAQSYTWKLCADINGKATFDLNQINSIVNKNSGLFVGYSRDSLITQLIGNKIITTASDTLYAFTLDGTCNSLPVKIILTAVPGPSLIPANDTVVCDFYILPNIAGTNLNKPIYTDILKGGGQTFLSGDRITQSGQIYIYDANSNCESIDSFSIQINTSLEAGLDNTLSICEGSDVDLNTLLKNNDPNGNFIEIGTNGNLNGTRFNSTGKNGQNFIFAYIQNNSQPCLPDTALLTISVVRNVTAGLDTSITICEGEIVNLSTLLRSADAGGVFIEANNNPSLQGNLWNSQQSGPGIFTIDHKVGDGVICPIDLSKLQIQVQAKIQIDSIASLQNCDYIILPKITGKNTSNAAYYTASNGTGTRYTDGDTVRTTTTLFLYATGTNFCSDERSVNIIINTSVSSNFIQSNLCPDRFFTVGPTRFDINNPSGQVNLKARASNGCDSIINVNLSYLNAPVTNYSNSICENEVIFIGGTRFDKNNKQGKVTLAASNGCDSIVNVLLTINPTTTGNYLTSVCKGKSVTINNKVYDENKLSGIDTLKAASTNGCDSIVQIQVTLNPSSQSNFTNAICNGQFFIINGKRYDANNPSGIETVQTTLGCDSTININLRVVPAQIFSLRETLCANESKLVGTRRFDINNSVYIDTLKNASSGGCDSIIDIAFTFKKIATDSFKQTLCENGSIQINNKIYNKANPSGTETLKSFNGCDSILHISLSFKTTVSSSYNDSICHSEFKTINGTRYDKTKLSGTELLLGAATGGCDSLLIINLSLKSAPTRLINQTICKDDFIVINGKRYDKNNRIGTDTITATNTISCDSILLINIDFTEYNLTYEKTILATAGDVIQLALLTDMLPQKIVWSQDPGLSCQDCINPNYTVSESKELNFELTDSLGCTITGKITITIKDDTDVFIPNVFSPNFDNTNDQFKLILPNESILIENLIIFDRWGELVYQETGTNSNTHKGWNGDFKGQPVNPGVYIYYVKLKTATGKILEYKGDVGLLR